MCFTRRGTAFSEHRLNAIAARDARESDSTVGRLNTLQARSTPRQTARVEQSVYRIALPLHGYWSKERRRRMKRRMAPAIYACDPCWRFYQPAAMPVRYAGIRIGPWQKRLTADFRFQVALVFLQLKDFWIGRNASSESSHAKIFHTINFGLLGCHCVQIVFGVYCAFRGFKAQC